MKLLLLATNSTDHTITVAVDGVKYEYWLAGDHLGIEREFRRLHRVGRVGDALNLLKARAYRYDNLTTPKADHVKQPENGTRRPANVDR